MPHSYTTTGARVWKPIKITSPESSTNKIIMKNIVVDPYTGDIGVKTLVKSAQPHVNDASVLRGVNRMLARTHVPKLAKRLINGRNTCVAPLEVCFHILDHMKGPKWDAWRAESGPNFKEALREYVERVCASEQEQQIQPMEEEQEVEESVEPKASIMQKALRAVNINGSVRIDDSINEASVIDVVRMVCPEASTQYSAQMLGRVLEKDRVNGQMGTLHYAHDSLPLAERVHYIRINGKPPVTPVADAKTIVEIIWLLPARAAREFRRQSAETICRVLGGDVSLCNDIEQRCARLQSTEEGQAYQSFMLDQQQQPVAKMHHPDEPFWFPHATEEEQRAYISALVKQDTFHAEISVHDTCKEKLKSVGRFATRDELEYADRIKDVQSRVSRRNNMITTGPVETSVLSVARPIDDSLDPETGLVIATHKCSESIRGPETSICNEAGKIGINVGDKAGQVGKVLKRLYIERYGEQAGRNIPKRDTTFRGKPFSEYTYFSRDSDLIQRAIGVVCGAGATRTTDDVCTNPISNYFGSILSS